MSAQKPSSTRAHLSTLMLCAFAMCATVQALHYPVGVEGILVVLLYRVVRAKFPDKVLKIPAWPLWILMAVYAAGAVYELIIGLYH